MVLDKTSVYRDSNWVPSDLMFSYSKKFGYYAYINTQVYNDTGEIVFKDAYHSCNRGKYSKVGEHILTRTSIVKVKGKIMDYKQDTIVVTTSGNTAKTFKNEEKALEWIEDTLDDSPKLKFKMFKPYQEIAPKRRNLKELTTAIRDY